MIEDLLEHIGIEDIRRLGDEIGARCPMHEKRTGEREHRPDHWSINRRTGAHHCFSCEYSGSLTRLIIDVTGVGIWEATKLIRQFDVEIGSHHQEEPWEPPIGATVESRLEDFGPAPPRALERRHLTPESCDRYQLRWDYEEAAWVIPIFSPTGEKWGWQTKAVDGIRNQPPGIKKGHTLFGFHLLSTSWALLVESPLDVVYLDTLSVPAVAAYGAQVSQRQMKLLMERLDSLVVALDNDKTGVRETRRLLEEKWHEDIPLRVFNYTGMEGKDPGELSPAEVYKGLDTAVLASFW